MTSVDSIKRFHYENEFTTGISIAETILVKGQLREYTKKHTKNTKTPAGYFSFHTFASGQAPKYVMYKEGWGSTEVAGQHTFGAKT